MPTSHNPSEENFSTTALQADTDALISPHSSALEAQIAQLQADKAALENQVQQLTQALASSEANYRTSEAKLNDILNSATAAICSLRVYDDGNYDYEYMSSGSEAVFGYTADEFLTNKALWRSRVFPDDIGRVLPPDYITQAITDIVPYRFYRKDGSLRWLSNHIQVRRDTTTNTWLMTIIDIDIHDRQMAEIALEQSEAKLSSILSNAGAAITQFRLFEHLQWIYEFYSSDSEVIFGYSVDELMHGGLWLSCVHPEDVEKVLIPAFEPLYSGQSSTAEFRFRQKDGSWRWISETATSKRDEADNCWIVTCVATDITDRKRIEEALRDSEAQYRRIVETANEGIWILDTDNRTSFVNPKMAEMLGYRSEEMIGKPLFEFMNAELVQFAAQYIARRHQGIFEQHDFKFHHKNGTDVWAMISANPILDDAGHYIGALGMITDISDRKALELALQASQTKLHDILNSAPAAITSMRLLMDGSWVTDYRSAGYELVFGYTPQELEANSGLWHLRVLPDDRDRVITPISNLQTLQPNRTVEYRFHHKDGNLRWISATQATRWDELSQSTVVTIIETDITSRKQIEAALRHSEERFQEIVQTISQFFFVRSALTGEYIYVSPAYENIWGRSCESLYQDPNSWLEAIHPDDRPHIRQSLTHQFSGNSIQREYRIVRPDGDIRWIFAQINLIRDEDGNPLRFIGFAEDISDRKQAEEALRSNEEQLRQILDNISDVFYLKDTATEQLIYLNPAYEKVYGQSSQSLYENPHAWIESIHPDDRALVLAKYQQELKGLAFFDDEYRLICPDGSIRWIWDRTFPIRDKQGNIYRYAGVNRDITERKSIEVALQQSEARFQTLVTNLPGMIYRYFPGEDGVGRFTYVSSGADELLEQEPAHILQNANLLWNMIYPEDLPSLQSSVAVAVQNCAPWRWEGRLTTPSGRLKWLQGNSRPQQTPDGVVWDGLLIDITDRKQIEIALHQSREELSLITNSLPACISYIDAEQRYRFVNKTYEDWFNQRKENIVGQTVREVVGETAYDLVRHYIEQALTGETIHFEMELPYLTKPRYITATLVPHIDAETSEVQGYYALINDISDRKRIEDEHKQAELALRQSETQFRAIFENAGIGISVCPFKPQIGKSYLENTNLVFQSILGYTHEELQYLSFMDVTYPEDLPEELRLIAECDAGANGYSLEKRYIHKNGSLIWTKLTVSLVRNTEGQTQLIIALIEDISDRKQFEQQLQLSLREKEILLTEIHHRVKNNLQVISSLLDLQSNRSQNLDLKMALKVSQDRIWSMALVHEALYRFEQFAEINFASYAEGLISHLLNTYGSSERPVLVHTDIDPSITIALDQAVPCGLILNELVTNVMKYGCAANPGHLYVSLERIAESEIRLTVGNAGDTLPKNFSISKDVSIGFTLVLVLTNQLSGRFDIERGDRTLFKVTFPLS